MKLRLFVKPTKIMRRRRRREFILLCCIIFALLIFHLTLVHVIDITFEENRELQIRESELTSTDENLQTDSTAYIDHQKKRKSSKQFSVQRILDWISSLSPFLLVETRLESIPAPPPLCTSDITTYKTEEEREDTASSWEQESTSIEASEKPVWKREYVSVDKRESNVNKETVKSCSMKLKEGSEHENFENYNTISKPHRESNRTDFSIVVDNSYNEHDHHVMQYPEIVFQSTMISSHTEQNKHINNVSDSVSFLSTWRTKETTYEEALMQYHHNLHVALPKGNPEQPSHEYTDLDSDSEGGIALPHNVNHEKLEQNWRACDTLNASFSSDRDALCQQYLANVNNMRSIRAMDSHLLQGRTIKMKIQYAHNNIEAIVKISQRKFVFEAASEYMAFVVDRAIGFNRVPTTIYTLLPLNFLRVAAAYSALYSQWFNRYVELYDTTRKNFVPCYQGVDGVFHAYENKMSEQIENGNLMCVHVAIQLWMREVHPTLDTFLALPYEYDDRFAEKYYVPGHPLFSSIKPSRLRAIGELLDRFIFDFLIGNSDRGMNDHNNFVYGGCSLTTECAVPKDPSARLKGLAKYAYLDHGSSLYSHKEVEGNPFFGEANRIKICRFRRATVESLRALRSTNRHPYFFIKTIEQHIPPSIYNIIPPSIIRKIQNRLDKVVRIAEKCEQTFTDDVVYSLPSYDSIRIAEEDVFQIDEFPQNLYSSEY